MSERPFPNVPPHGHVNRRGASPPLVRPYHYPLNGTVQTAAVGAVVTGGGGGVRTVRRGPGALRITRAQLVTAAVVGTLLLFGGNGFVALAEQTVPSGLAALLVSTTPLQLVSTYAYVNPVVAVILGRVLLGEHISLPVVVGGALAVAGVVIVISS